MRFIDHLPGREDGVAGLISLADQLGDEAVFNLIRRCRTTRGEGCDPAGDTLTILAKRMITAAAKHTSTAAARNTVAVQLGYGEDWRYRSSFYRMLNSTVTTTGDSELLTLARHHGDAAVCNLIMLCRRGPGHNDGREALTILARRMVDTEIDHANVDELTARQNVSLRLGYTASKDGNTRSNFLQILKGGRTPSKQAGSRYRPTKGKK